jgi:hypothetical protein
MVLKYEGFFAKLIIYGNGEEQYPRGVLFLGVQTYLVAFPLEITVFLVQALWE